MSCVSPVFCARNVARALEHYRALGFDTRAYRDGPADDPVYGFMTWDSVEIHVARHPELDPKTTTVACYLYVSDADALHAQWTAAKVAGRLTHPEDTPYGLREFAHIDPDGNLLRVGSNLAGPDTSRT